MPHYFKVHVAWNVCLMDCIAGLADLIAFAILELEVLEKAYRLIDAYLGANIDSRLDVEVANMIALGVRYLQIPVVFAAVAEAVLCNCAGASCVNYSVWRYQEVCAVVASRSTRRQVCAASPLIDASDVCNSAAWWTPIIG